MRGRPAAALCYLAALLTPCRAEMLLLDVGTAGATTPPVYYAPSSYSAGTTGCDVPPTTYAHAWYVDPVNGNDTTGDGSSGNPWKTLQTVLSSKVSYQAYNTPYTTASTLHAVNPSGPVSGGDVIYLESGTHSGVKLINAYNSSYITIKAASGATPVLPYFDMAAGSHWAVEGLSVTSLGPDLYTAGVYKAIFAFTSSSFNGPLNNITLDSNTVYASTAAVDNSWQPSDFRTNFYISPSVAEYGIYISAGITPLDYAGVNDGECFTVTHNVAHDVPFGIAATLMKRMLIENNEVYRVTGDGIDYDCSTCIVRKNYIHDQINIGDSIHQDGIQGQMVFSNAEVHHDVTIDSNTVIARVDPSLIFPACSSGMTEQNGSWWNVNVYNNLTITAAFPGISEANVTNLNIINNTVLSLVDAHNCSVEPGAIDADGPSPTQGLSPDNTNDVQTQGYAQLGAASAVNALIENNIAAAYNNINNGGSGTTFNNNIIIGTGGKTITAGPGVTLPTVVSSTSLLFNNFAPASYAYDVTLASGSPAIGAGATFSALTYDIVGASRSAPYDIGAYAH